jgi:hypothetical protein
MSDQSATAEAAAVLTRRLRKPGAAAAAAAESATAEAAAGAESDDEDLVIGEDARTPGLQVQEDGSILYAGKVYRRPFATPHGTVVPPCSVEAPGLNGRR